MGAIRAPGRTRTRPLHPRALRRWSAPRRDEETVASTVAWIGLHRRLGTQLRTADPLVTSYLCPTWQLRALLQLSSGGIAGLIHRLERAAHVSRHANTRDRRSAVVRLTPATSCAASSKAPPTPPNATPTASPAMPTPRHRTPSEYLCPRCGRNPARSTRSTTGASRRFPIASHTYHDDDSLTAMPTSPQQAWRRRRGERSSGTTP